MATARMSETKKIQLSVETGTSASGKAVYSVRTLSNIKTELSDDDARAIGAAYGSLQMYPVGKIVLAETAVLVEE